MRLKNKCLGILMALSSSLVMAGDVVDFKVVQGDDAPCPAGYAPVPALAAMSYKDFACRAIGSNDGARLTEHAAMSGASGGCNVYGFAVNKTVPTTLCYQVKFQQIAGEVVAGGSVQCPTGTRLATVAEAAIFNKQACAALSSQYNVARIADGGSVAGAAYGCVVKGVDAQGKGHSLCVPE